MGFFLNSFEVKFEPFDWARPRSYDFQVQHVSLSRINGTACLMEVLWLSAVDSNSLKEEIFICLPARNDGE